ncbi:MFS transporter [Alkalihalobacillus alcalophilus ATCC 27647 = CGMCC 1.3604]|uniref:MFS transporter n=1 Tax=Alkalihalobacillus alcalophilus ATCC 27647 = CGMCC 1.3604 TaxID=1218173 RepID=J8TMQ6_ALKAL|nr:MFS transporter [Alkalihalobacillus alcalophilus]AFV25914.1 multidrug efflux transporter [Alkalihalobacillus alcalophilus ATCC 27647 = CGMCC 1.3604]KGA98786.1 MFS transporter [Alkalihalobacillus alcalophilus ATCC 27647 = CGMCC 1.3604]MED1560968.1 MFS transporter [Alkalihalobacillus alcalophilus]THG91243.1 MFS transporter [Alkalihalobacillus alcalophilus ATCC 27647 = CGMCC 1.3604]
MLGENKKLAILSIASIPLVMTLGNSMLIPVLPIIEKELDITSLQVSMLITIYSVVAIICIPIAGYLSDQIGRKKVIIPSLVISGIGGLVSGLASVYIANPYYMILIGRLLQGVGAAGASPIVMPLVGDMYRDQKEVSKGLGMIETSNTFGKVLSPILGASLAAIQWYIPFFSFPVFCLISIILMAFLVKSPALSTEKVKFPDFLKILKGIFKREGRWLYAVFIIGGICMFVLFGVLFYLSTMLEEEHNIEGIKKGIVLAVPLTALCCSSFVTGKLIGQNKQKMKEMTIIGLIGLTLSIAVIAFSEDIYILLTCLFISGIGIGFALPSLDALVTEGIVKEQRGSVTSFYSSMRFVGVALGPPIFTLLIKISHQFLFLSNAILCLIILLLAIFFIEGGEKSKITW